MIGCSLQQLDVNDRHKFPKLTPHKKIETKNFLSHSKLFFWLI